MKKKNRILRYLKQGMRKSEIARKVEVSRTYVYKILNQQTNEPHLQERNNDEL
jgi:DNA invertase Pin-like site-specific DNA recombinase